MGMTWMEAVAAMREGKRVKRSWWEAKFLRASVCGDIRDSKWECPLMHLNDFEADDWEVCAVKDWEAVR